MEKNVKYVEIFNYVSEVFNLKKTGRFYSRGMRGEVVGMECEGGVSVEIGEFKSSYGIDVYRGREILRFKIRKDDEWLGNYLRRNRK